MILPRNGLRSGAASALVALCAAAGAAGVAGAAVATSRVTYLAGGTVYVDAGRLDGIVLGDTLRVTREGVTISRLVVRFLSSHRVSCDTIATREMPRVGDAVRYLPGAIPADAGPGAAAREDTASSGAAPTGAEEAAPSPAARRTGPRPWRGRVGAGLLAVQPGSGAPGYTQPSLDLRIDGDHVGGRGIDVALDVRTRRTFRDAGGDDGEARVYRFSLTLHDAARGNRLTFGRQRSPSVAEASVFDGALVEVPGRRWDVGLFSGAQPDPQHMTPSFDVLQHGAYAAVHSLPMAARQWSVVAGAIASLDSGEINRNFLYLRSGVVDPRISFSVSQEIDLNSGWKLDAGERKVAPTSTFAVGRWRVRPAVTLDAGYDNRRSVRLYRDRVSPVTEFDDSYRQGVWAGGSVGFLEHLRVAADTRWNAGGAGGDFHSWTATAEILRMPVLQSDLRGRWTRFTGDISDGWLSTGALGVRPAGRTRIEVNAGRRTSHELLTGADLSLDWIGADADVSLGRRWYVLISGERDRGAGGAGVVAYLTLSRLL